MPRLIHLNGMPRVGKSTLARRYVEDHPGTLLVDIDVLTGMIGGWREQFGDAWETAHQHARALTRRHLELGRDVVVPQLFTIYNTDPGWEDVAGQAGCDYVEVTLLLDETEHWRRLLAKQPVTEVEAEIQRGLAESDVDGPGELVERIRGHLTAYLDGRPDAVRIDTTGADAEQTYRELLSRLG